MKRLTHIICTLAAAALLAGCARAESDGPDGTDGELVPVELVGAGGAATVTRAGIDPTLTTVTSATIIVFDNAGVWMQTRHVDYTAGQRVYLKRGGTYKVFAIANLVDDNCPGSATAADYFADVRTVADLDGKYMRSTVAPGAKPTVVPMISGTVSNPLQTIVVPGSLTSPYTVNVPLRSLYTKVEVNVYNRVDAGGTSLSLVEPLQFYANNLPVYSNILESASLDPLPSADYAQTQGNPATHYANVALDYLPLASVTPKQNATTGYWYVKQSIDIYCLENRRGSADIDDVHSIYDRKSEAPPFALEIVIRSYANNKVLDTFIIPGRGRDDVTMPVGGDDLLDYNVDRNCIYHMDVYINGANEGNITQDSRRVYLDTVVCGELDDPTGGTAGEF